MVKKILIKDNNFKINEEIVACIGFFDGLHLGHQELVNKAIYEANKLGLKSALICFNPDPVEIISKKKNNHIFSNRERENLIRSFGIDIFIVISFDEKMMKMDPVSFINDYLNKMNIKELVSGFDFSSTWVTGVVSTTFSSLTAASPIKLTPLKFIHKLFPIILKYALLGHFLHSNHSIHPEGSSDRMDIL